MKTCTFEGCERKYHAKGYCSGHNVMLKKYGALRPILSRDKTIRTCNIEGCERKHEAKGLCKYHWSKQHYNRQDSASRQSNIGKLCSVNECKSESICLGYCSKHYCRWRTNGTTDLISRPITIEKCLYKGCDKRKHNHGYCFRHYREIILKIECNPKGGHNKKQKVKCDIENCDNYAISKGWCSKHYRRYRRHGDPMTCYIRPRKSEYISLDNILKCKGTYSRKDDENIIMEYFLEYYDEEEENKVTFS